MHKEFPSRITPSEETRTYLKIGFRWTHPATVIGMLHLSEKNPLIFWEIVLQVSDRRVTGIDPSDS
jgi:hypothetical protein